MKEKTHLFIMKYISNDYEVCYKRGCKEYHGASPRNQLMFDSRKRHKLDEETIRNIKVNNMIK